MRTLPNNSQYIPGPKRDNSAAKLSVVSKQSVDKNFLRKYTSEWLDALRAAGKSPKTLHDYADKMGKFHWWWEEYTGFGESIGLLYCKFLV